MRIQRGAVYLADLNPSRGTEPGQIGPVVVVQTNLINTYHPSTLVCPITTNVKKQVKYLRVHLSGPETGLDKSSDIMADQLRAIDNRRLLRQVGEVPRDQMKDLSENLKIILEL